MKRRGALPGSVVPTKAKSKPENQISGFLPSSIQYIRCRKGQSPYGGTNFHFINSANRYFYLLFNREDFQLTLKSLSEFL